MGKRGTSGDGVGRDREYGSRALSEERGTASEWLLAAVDGSQIEGKAAQSVSLFQLLARGYPAGGDDVRPLPVIAAERRGPVIRARHRPLP